MRLSFGMNRRKPFARQMNPTGGGILIKGKFRNFRETIYSHRQIERPIKRS
jgi:hypothetical protein